MPTAGETNPLYHRFITLPFSCSDQLPQLTGNAHLDLEVHRHHAEEHRLAGGGGVSVVHGRRDGETEIAARCESVWRLRQFGSGMVSRGVGAPGDEYRARNQLKNGNGGGGNGREYFGHPTCTIDGTRTISVLLVMFVLHNVNGCRWF